MKLCPKHIPSIASSELIELTDEEHCEDCEIIRIFRSRLLDQAALKLSLMS